MDTTQWHSYIYVYLALEREYNPFFTYSQPIKQLRSSHNWSAPMTKVVPHPVTSLAVSHPNKLFTDQSQRTPMVSLADVLDWLTHLISFDATSTYHTCLLNMAGRLIMCRCIAFIAVSCCRGAWSSWSKRRKIKKKTFSSAFLRLYCQSAHAPILKSSAVLSAKRVITGAKRHTSRAKAAPGQATKVNPTQGEQKASSTSKSTKIGNRDLLRNCLLSARDWKTHDFGESLPSHEIPCSIPWWQYSHSEHA